MHGVLAVGGFVGGGRKWPRIRNALIVGVEITRALTAVAVGVDRPFA